MAIYRFKVFLEDNEDVFRDIDIKAAQNFEQFHTIIQEAFKFDSKHASAFFVSDDYWRKGQEITLRKEDLPLEEEEIRKNVDPKKLMSETKIAKFIEQPHQRFVYVFDPIVQWTFLLEMIKIVEDNPKITYPSIVKSYGTAPKQYKQVNVAKEELSPDMAMAGLLDDLNVEDEEVYKTLDTGEEAVEEDDINSLEGEEGEEESEDDSEDGEGSSDYGFDAETED
ncbi:IS1096 element passenger TnpR family protein [Aurantibacillus circumpalustris]|uniref:IS1096 element passenger TnpR family protein n=1 Tax=Aurantibacillus circumpalustris TaxID=3036359 RepID=UPI00295ACACF|nr:hypothetical protein [Aurantibacillus circumpalustris]